MSEEQSCSCDEETCLFGWGAAKHLCRNCGHRMVHVYPVCMEQRHLAECSKCGSRNGLVNLVTKNEA